MARVDRVMGDTAYDRCSAAVAVARLPGSGSRAVGAHSTTMAAAWRWHSSSSSAVAVLSATAMAA